jgi:hypothetical protein
MKKKGISLNSLKAVKEFIACKSNFIENAYKDSIYENKSIQFETVDFKSIYNLADEILCCKFNNKHIGNYADVMDIMHLIHVCVLECIIENMNPSQFPQKVLIHENELLDNAVNRISKFIYEGPYDYNITFLIPNFHAPSSSIPISSEIVLDKMAISGHAPISEVFSNALNAASVTRQEHFYPCIRITCKGYVGSTQSSPLIVRTLSTLKHFIMLGHITGLLQIKFLPDFEIFGDRPNEGSYYVLGPHSNNVQKRIPSVYHAALSSIHPTERALKLFRDLHYEHNNNIKEITIIKNCIESTTESCERIKSSTEWLFESIFTESTTPSYVMLCLAIEAMFGSTDRNKKEILSSRIAYCLGKTYEERNEIIKQFSVFYDKRSKIVHGSETLLTADDKFLAMRMRSFLEHMIDADLNASFVLQ